MFPKSFEYVAPHSLNEAVSLLTKNKDARILAGGHSLLPLMKLRLALPKYIIDINKVPNLSYVEVRRGKIVIGALTRDHEIETSDVIKTRLPILNDAARVIGDPQVRNLATIGGNLCHSDPANDYPATMLALDAEFVARGLRGERIIRAEDFFVDTFLTSLKKGEILTGVRIPIPLAHSGGCYLKLERKVGDFATVGVAAQLRLDPNKNLCKAAGIGLTSVGSTAIKARKAEQKLIGTILDEKSIDEASRAAMEESQPTADLRGSIEYKKDMVRVFVKRALRLAASRASGA